MIGDDNAVNAVVDGEEGVFGGGDAFDPDLHFWRALGFEPVNVAVPAQGWVCSVSVEGDGARGRASLFTVVVAWGAGAGVFW